MSHDWWVWCLSACVLKQRCLHMGRALHSTSLCLSVCVRMTKGCMCSSGDTHAATVIPTFPPFVYEPLTHLLLYIEYVRPPFLQYLYATWYSSLLLLGAPLTPVRWVGGSCLQVFRVTTQQPSPLLSISSNCYWLLPKDLLADPTTSIKQQQSSSTIVSMYTCLCLYLFELVLVFSCV